MVSVIIPALNEAKWLPGLLTDISRQTWLQREVVVADARSTDRTRAIARSFGAAVADGGFPGAGRNAGARIARGQYFLFLDADVRVDGDFIERAVGEYEARRLGFAICRYRRDRKSISVALSYFGYNLLIHACQYFWPSVAGCAMLLTTRSLFERLGGFDERLRLAEDYDFFRKASSVARFRVLDDVKVTVSSRRLDKEGAGAYALQGIINKSRLLLQGRMDVSRHMEYRYGEFVDQGEGSSEEHAEG
jgi:glycosyltransferase involved in cell wall biosynthesis